MLYLLTPSLSLLWNSMPTDTIELAKKHGGDLGRLDWDATEEPHDPATAVRVALRYGVDCSRGMVIPAWELGQAERPIMLTRLTANLLESNAAIAANNDGVMEAVIPGWTKHSREKDQELSLSLRKSIAEAQEDADELLNAPELPHLVSAWQRMGGIIVD